MLARRHALLLIASSALTLPTGCDWLGGSDPFVGKQIPPLEAGGWLNGVPPTSQELIGKVAVVSFFASW